MLALPTPMIRLLRPFEAVFRETTWEHAKVLLTGAILTPAKRTVASALSVMGLWQEQLTHAQALGHYRAQWIAEHGYHRFKAGAIPACRCWCGCPNG
jgi:transposase